MEFSVKDFKRDYEKYGAGELEKQLPHLQRLAEKYIGRAAETGDWVDYVKAHGLLNSCIIRCSSLEVQSDLHTKIFDLECCWYDGEHPLKSPDQLHKRTADLKKGLDIIRSGCRSRFGTAGGMTDSFNMTDLFSEENKEKMASFSKQAYIDSKLCTDEMIGFARKICETSESIVGDPCSPYVAVALGSIARNEATPYSDLEYAFIIGPDGDKSYFHRLAVDTYFRISNLGETPLKYLYIEELYDNYRARGEKRWFEDRAKSGFKIDGLMPKAGNIPTGNGLPDGQSLILTVEELVSKYGQCLEENVAGNKPDVVGDLSDLLASVVPVHWSDTGKKLLDEFRWYRTTKEDEISATEDGRIQLEKKREKTLQADLKRYDMFSSKPGELRLDMRSVQVKSDIFRYPTILAHDLKVLLKASLNLDQCETAWEIYEELHRKEIINADTLPQFQFILMSAIWIRTSAYLIGNTQREFLAFHPKFDKAERDDRFFVPKNLYVMMASRLIPIKRSILSFLDNRSELGYAQSVITALSQLNVSDISFEMQSRIHYSCTDFKGALRAIHRTLGETSTTSLTSLLDAGLARADLVLLTLNTLFQNGLYNITIKLCGYLIEADSPQLSYSTMALYHGIKGQCLMILGNYIDQSVEFDKLRKAIMKLFSPDETAAYLALFSLLKNKQSDQRVLDAVKELKKIVHHGLVINLRFAADSIRYHQGIYNEHQISFKLLLSIYDLVMKYIIEENVNTLLNADLKSSIGLSYLQVGDYNLAEEHLVNADRIYKDIYGKSAATVEISTIKLYLGYIEFKRGKLKLAREMCRDSLDILYASEQGLSTHFLANHQIQAEILAQMGNFEQAQDHIEKCYDLITDQSEGTPKFSKAIALTTEGDLIFRQAKASEASIAEIMSKYNQAQTLLKQAIDILQEAVQPKHFNLHPDIALAYKIMGEIFLARGDQQQAIKFLTKAEEGFAKAYDDGNNRPHIDLADAIFLIGEVRRKAGDNSEARLQFKRAIPMMQKIFGTEEPQHPIIQAYISRLQSCGPASTSLQDDDLD